MTAVATFPCASSAAPTTQFATDLYRKLAGENPGQNVGLSPANIAHALALTSHAANRSTRKEIEDVLELTSLQLCQDFANSLRSLPSLVGPDNKLSLASNIWTDRQLPVSNDFTETVGRLFGPAHAAVDFLNDHEGVRRRINQVVSDATNARIPELLAQDTVDAATRLAITTAIYLRMNWASRFDKDLTRVGAFTLANGTQVDAPFMHKYGEEFPHYFDNQLGVEVLELPYKDSSLSFLAILPYANMGQKYLARLENLLTPNVLNNWFKKLDQAGKTILERVVIPKFNIATEYNLNDVLQALGIREAFGPRADFSGIDPSITPGQLQISNVVHKAVIKVDEEGSEAAGATAVITATSLMPNFIANRPFMWAIRDKTTGQVLFIGRIADPTAGAA